eukprot:TRINITY_DN6476_c0_g1_i10.p1 TRINITY_DN6476_c0_g1~~TRINITY_DN6476_c0_g1_i10.p1  ORF type:complete len:2413 (+),score=464.51 TRINITY_DN6476_c0_g1_i10:263-7501(+)
MIGHDRLKSDNLVNMVTICKTSLLYILSVVSMVVYAWEQVDENPTVIMFGSVAQNSTHVYLMGGFRNNDKLGDPNLEYTHMSMVYQLTHDNAESFRWNLVRAGGDVPPRRHGACAALINNRVYLFGGITQQGKDDFLVYILDLATRTWSSTVGASSRSGIPSHRQRHGCVSFSGSMYLMGGMLESALPGGSKTASDTWRFDTASMLWSRIQETGPGTLGRHSYNSYLDGNAWKVIMGKRDSTMTDTVYSFDFATNTWSEVGKIGATLTRQGACGGLVGNKFVVYGGTPSNEGSLNYDVAVLETSAFAAEFSEARSVWDTMPFISPGPKAFSQGFVLKGRLYCQGGYSKSDFCVDEDVWAFNPESRLWDMSSTTAYPIGRSGMSLIPVSGGKLITFGGLGCRKDPLNYNDVWMFDSASKSWEKLVAENKDANQPLGRSNAMHAIVDGKLWLFGGERFGGLQDRDYWVFNIENKVWSKVSSVDNTTFLASSRNSLATVQQGNKVYVWGGKSSDAKADAGYVHVVELAESGVQVSGFKPSGVAPVARSSFSAFMFGGKYCIFGGGTQSSQNDMWCLDLVSQAWERIVLDLQSPVLALRSSAYSFQDRLFVTNGFDGADTITQVWTFDPVVKAWTRIKTDDILPKFWSSAGAIVGKQLYVFGGGISFGFGNQVHTLDLGFCSGTTDVALPVGVHVADDGSGAGRYMAGSSCSWRFSSATHVYISASSFGTGDSASIQYKDAQAKDKVHTLSGQNGANTMLTTVGGFTASFQSDSDDSVGQGFSMRVFVCPSGNVVVNPASEGCTCPANTYRVANMECVACPDGMYQPKTNQTFCFPNQLPQQTGGRNEWKNESPSPYPRMSPYTAVVGSTGYVFGGFAQGLSEAERQYFSLDKIHTINNLDFHTWRENTGNGEVPLSRDGACVVSLESQIFLIGGYDPTKMTLLSDVYVLNANTFSWRLHSDKTGIPARRDHGCVALGGKIYVFGGRTASDYIGDLWEINFATQAFTKITLSGDSNLLARSSFITFVNANEIFLFGGSVTSGLVSTGVAINLATKTLTSKGTPQTDYKTCGGFDFCLLNRAYSMHSVWDGKLYVFGGATQTAGSPSFEAVSDVVAIDIATWKVDSYTRYSSTSRSRFPISTPPPRYSGSSLQVGKLSLVIGGSAQFKTSGFSCILSEGWVWDNAAKVWKDTSLDHYPNARRSPSLAAAGNDVFMFGGEICRESDLKVNDFWVYHTDNRTWELLHRESASNLNPAPRKSSVLEHYDGTLFLVGGDNNEPSIETWTFNIKSRLWTTLILRSPTGKPPLYANQPNQRKGISGAAIGEYLYMWGGRPSYMISSIESLCVFVLNMKEKKVHGDYTFNTPAPSLRLGASAFRSSEKVCFYGGSTDTDPFVEDIWCYTPGTKDWRVMFGAGNGTHPTAKDSTTAISNGKLVVFGGAATDSGARMANLASYDPENDIWVSLDSTGDARSKISEQGSTAVSNRIFYFGGHASQGYSDQLSSYEFGYCSQNKVLQASISGTAFGDGSLDAKYDAGTICSWTLNKANYIRFDSMELGAGDFVSVYNSANMEASSMIGQYSNSQIFASPQKPLQSSTGTVIVRLTSDKSEQSNGFKATFFGCPANSQLDDNSVCVCDKAHYRQGDACVKCVPGDQDVTCFEENKESAGANVPLIAGLVTSFVGLVGLGFAVYYRLRSSHRKVHQMIQLERIGLCSFSDISFEKLLGEGPTFEVFMAHLRGSSIVAKRILFAAEALACDTVINDLEKLSETRHPNLLLYMGCVDNSPNTWLLFEYMEKGSLYDLKHNLSIPLPVGRIAVILNGVAQGLQYLHLSQPSIIHGALSSRNILVGDKWAVKLSDYGLTSIRKLAPPHLQPILPLFWIAPEVLKGQPPNPKSDMYSLGVVVWELFSRRDPYDDQEVYGVVNRVISESLRPSLEGGFLDSATPESFVSLIKQAFLEKAEERPQASDLINICSQYSQNDFDSSSQQRRTTKGPVGKIALVFLSLENSDFIWEECHDVMPDALNLYSGYIRNMVTKHKGYEVKAERETFMIAFPQVNNALKFAAEVQKGSMMLDWPQKLLRYKYAAIVVEKDDYIFRGPRLKMGIHVGTPRCEQDIVTGRTDYFGSVVNAAARIKSYARGGQTMISEEIYKELLATKYDFEAEQTNARDIGEVKLRGIRAPMRLFEFLPVSLMNRILHQVDEVDNESVSSAQHSVSSNEETTKNGDSSNSYRWEIDMEKVTLTDKVLGSGSFGSSILGNYKGKEVAVKKLHKQFVTEKGKIEFIAEVMMVRMLDHPNVVSFIGASIQEDGFYMLMEYMNRGNLHEAIIRGDFQSPSKQSLVAREVAKGMLYLHTRSPIVIHRDLKSTNVLLHDSMIIKICDFGMSRTKAENRTMTRCGTGAWIAPEVADLFNSLYLF